MPPQDAALAGWTAKQLVFRIRASLQRCRKSFNFNAPSGPLARFCLPILEAPGRVELPTNGLGNKGFHPLLSWLIHLRVGTSPLNWGQAPQTAVIWQQVLGYLALITDETSCARQVVSRDRRRARPPPHLMVWAEAAVVPAKSPARMVNTSARAF